MNVYTTCDFQHHCIVADSMEEAVKLYRKEYEKEPERLEFYSHYVLVQKEANDEDGRK